MFYLNLFGNPNFNDLPFLSQSQVQKNKYNKYILNHFEEKYFQPCFTIKFSISSQNVFVWIDIQCSKGVWIQHEIQSLYKGFDAWLLWNI
jgi:hypothetical protein